MTNLKFQQINGGVVSQPSGGDVFPYVHDPGGTPSDKQTTFTNIFQNGALDWKTTGGLQIGKRFLQNQGANVASTNNLTLPTDGNYFVITGTTQINLIDSTGWTAGSTFIFGFTGNLTIKNNQPASANFSKIITNGGLSDLLVTAGQFIRGFYDGTNFNIVAF